MKKCIVISDSFKGSLSSMAICEVAANSISRFFPDCEVIALPVADGGEGTVECFLRALPGQKITLPVHGPYQETIEASYARFGATAVIEMSAAAGLPLTYGKKNPSLTTTYGVGELMRHAVSQGAAHIILGLGGSATNDGGCGCAAAMGVEFYNSRGEKFLPVGASLDQIAKIDISPAKELLKNCAVTAMCDIENPMYGPAGAAYIFAPQKGASEEMTAMLDKNLRAFDTVLQSQLNIPSLGRVPGTGAAGAMGAGAIAFFGARLKSGIETVLDLVGFDQKLEGCDLVITGEGKIDSQSLKGKVVIGVARRAKKQNVPVIAIVGDVADDAYGAYEQGVSAIFSINRLAVPRAEAKQRSYEDYQHTLEDVLRLMKAIKKHPF